jgi:hypothetical protein
LPSDDSLDPRPGVCGRAGFDGDAPDQAGPVVLELIIAGTEPISGTVRRAGSEDTQAFHGWIDLMTIIGSLGAGEAGG